jgi:hypothetical protein
MITQNRLSNATITISVWDISYLFNIGAYYTGKLIGLVGLAGEEPITDETGAMKVYVRRPHAARLGSDSNPGQPYCAGFWHKLVDKGV